jgi:hypothetical protein
MVFDLLLLVLSFLLYSIKEMLLDSNVLGLPLHNTEIVWPNLATQYAPRR